MKDVVIVGISGQARSGKDMIAEMLLEEGFFGLSFGDFMREFARERHKDDPNPISRENLTETSNWLRKTRGPDVILQEALRQFNERQKAGKKDKGLVLWSIRAPIEVDWILEHGGEMVYIDTSDEVRYQRHIANLREGEPIVDFQEFLRQDATQYKPQPGIPREIQMDIDYVKQKATITIENNGNDLEKFKSEVRSRLQKFLK